MIVKKVVFLWVNLFALSFVSPAYSHEGNHSISQLAADWLVELGPKSEKVQISFLSPVRYKFAWTPGVRMGIRLDELSGSQKAGLQKILTSVLSKQGSNKVDAILATEAALAVMQNSPEYRNPGKYYTAVFGTPGKGHWGLRFEGHHISINLTFDGDEIISASPLFWGANPETIAVGPDQGLRALKDEVDFGKKLYASFDEKQIELATASNEWFAGFLTDAGSRRANMGKPVGIKTQALSSEQNGILRALISVYIESINENYSIQYLSENVEKDWKNIRFFWKGSATKGENFYFRIVGSNLLIEQETQGSDTHIHTIWRDAKNDFGGL